jgi:hypothetical protein
MVIGARAASTDGRIEDLTGVDAQAGYKQTITQWCFGAVSPPLIVEVSDPIPSPENVGKFCYVIYTAESDVAPHFLNGRKGIYVRTDEFSSRFEARLANENELRHLLDRRRLILDRRANLLERAKKRFDTFAAKTHTDRSGVRTKMGPLLELCIVPRFPARPICEQGKLKSLITSNVVYWRGDSFPYGQDIISQHESAIVLKATGELSAFEANTWGMLFYCANIESDSNGSLGIHLYGLVGLVLLFVKHAGKMLESMGYSGPILIETTLRSIINVPWLYAPPPWNSLTSRAGSPLDDIVAFTVNATTEGLRENPDETAMDILRFVFFAVNWPEVIADRGNFVALIQHGYKYNFWA